MLLKRISSFFLQSVSNKTAGLCIPLPLIRCGHTLSLSHPKVRQYIDNANVSSSQVQKPQLHAIIKSIRVTQLELSELEKMGKENPELKEIAIVDIANVQEILKALEKKFFEAVLEPEELDISTNELVLELSAGVGGQEAMLFTQELYQMYLNVAYHKGWERQLLSGGESELGVRHATLQVKGPSVYSHLKFEAGVHRVQRVPKTEKAGRVHTSTATVAVLPSPSSIQIQIPPQDLKIETKRATGAGGQHVNTTESAVRLTHLPTGLTVDSQTERSQIRNRELGLQLLRSKLYELQLCKQVETRRTVRKLQVGFGNRNEKIRTYNFPQDRVTDHRIGVSVFNLNGFMSGGKELLCMIDSLKEFDQNERLNQLFA